MMKKLGESETFVKAFKGLCNKCGEQGHMAKDCKAADSKAAVGALGQSFSAASLAAPVQVHLPPTASSNHAAGATRTAGAIVATSSQAAGSARTAGAITATSNQAAGAASTAGAEGPRMVM